MLEQMAERPGAEPFAVYALALEYKNLGREGDALSRFERLRSEHPDYLPMYLMAGQMLIELERESEARPWLEAGILIAQKRGDSRALGELQAALSECEGS